MKKEIVGIVALAMVLMAFTIGLDQEAEAAKNDMTLGPDVASGATYIHGYTGGGTSAGWGYVDVEYPDEVKAGDPFDISYTVKLGTEVYLLQKDFEGGLGSDWYATGQWHATDYNYNSEDTSVVYNNQATNMYGGLTGLPGSGVVGNTWSIDLTMVSNPHMTFWSWQETEHTSTEAQTFDSRYVEVSPNNGWSWITLPWGGANLVSSSYQNWYQYDFDLSAYTGSSQFKVRFAFSSNGMFDNYEGWYVDDVEIAGMLVPGDLINSQYMWVEGNTGYGCDDDHLDDAMFTNWEEEYTYTPVSTEYYVSTDGDIGEAGRIGADPVTIEPFNLDGVDGNVVNIKPQHQSSWSGMSWYRSTYAPVETTWTLKGVRIIENTTFNLFIDEDDGWIPTWSSVDSSRSFEVSVAQAKDYKARAYEVLDAIPPQQYGKCKGIESLTLDYTGGAGADMEAYKAVVTDNGDGTYTFTPGEDSTKTTKKTSKGTGSKKLDKLPSNLKIYVDGELDQEIHTSCSKPIDVDDVFGDYTVTAVDKIFQYKPIKEIEKALKEIWNSLGGKVCKGIKEMTVSYTGGSGADIEVYKGVVTDNGDGTYTITPAPKTGTGTPKSTAKTATKGVDKLPGETKIYVDGELAAQIHTSCSKPIMVDDVHGEFTITGLKKVWKGFDLWEDNSKLRLDPKHGKKVFDYEAKAAKELMKLLKDYNKGKLDIDWEVIEAVQIALDHLIDADDLLAKIAIWDAECLAPEDCVKAHKEIGKAWESWWKAQDDLEPYKCKGITSMTLNYESGEGADIEAYRVIVTDDGDGNYTLTPGEKTSKTSKKTTKKTDPKTSSKHTKTGSKIEDKLPGNTKIYIDGEHVVDIHTSCSKPIRVGFVYGDFEVVAIEKILVPKEIDYHKAIQDFKKAWEHAQKSIKESYKCLNPKCKGVEWMEVLYEGGAGADIEVYKGTVTDNGDGTYLIEPCDGTTKTTKKTTKKTTTKTTKKTGTGTKKVDKLGANTKIYVDGELVATIHTSCSQPINIDDVHGPFTITDLGLIY